MPPSALVPPSFPVRSIKECNTIMTMPGMPFEMEQIELPGIKETVRAYKNLPGKSLREVWLGSKIHGDRDYIVYQDDRYTYAQAHQRVIELAHLFKDEYGCLKGDRIAIASRNLPEWILSFWAAELLGCVAVAVNAWLDKPSLLWCLTHTECKVIIVDGERANVLQGRETLGAIEKAGTRAVVVLRETVVPAGMMSLNRELEEFIGRDLEIPEVEIGLDEVATIFFTSGTTGLPKGVVGTNRQYISNILNSIAAPIRAILRRGELPPAPDPTAAQKSYLLSVPLFHATGNHSVMSTGTVLGYKIVLMHKWSIPLAASLIISEKITSAGGVPFMAGELLLASGLTKENSVLESIAFGGGPANAGLSKEISEKFPACLPGQGYGATELSSAAATFTGEDFLLRPTSTGLPCPINDFKIVSPETGAILPSNAIGEIYIRGSNRTNGYWKNEKATKEVFLEDGYYRTGDIGKLDEEGFVYILDRAKDIIIRGGENIASVTIENAIFTDPGVLDVAVVAVPDSKLGEVVAARVTTKPNFSHLVTESSVINLVARTLPKHCVPVLVVVNAETIPRNAVGKHLKKDLRDVLAQIWEERGRVPAAAVGGVEVKARL